MSRLDTSAAIARRLWSSTPKGTADTRPRVQAAHQAAGLPTPQIRSPFQGPGSSLSTIVWADLFDGAEFPATRTEAMGVPAMAKARHVLCPKIAGYPLRAIRHDKETNTDTQIDDPTWATRTSGVLSTWHRMVWTVDDLMFSGYSLWKAERGAFSDGRPVLAFDRVNIDEWEINQDGQLLVHGSPVRGDDWVLIPGPHEGLLTFGRTAIRHARQLAVNALVASLTPSAQTELRQTVALDTPLTDVEIDDLIARYASARTGNNGGVSFTSYGVEAVDHGSIDGALLIDGRNAAAVDMARLAGIAAAMVDATTPKSTLTYETTQGRGLEHTEYGVEPYAEAIAARLSMDDVTPRGTRVRFDFGSDLGPVQPTGPTVED